MIFSFIMNQFEDLVFKRLKAENCKRLTTGSRKTEEEEFKDRLKEAAEFFLKYIWVFPKIGVPQNGWL